MSALKEPYEATLSGSGQIVGVVGEAGVGKSRLLLEFINHLPLDKVIHLEGRCLHHGRSIIYLPILEIVKKYFDIREDDQDFAINKKLNEKISALDEKLVDTIPPLQDILSLKVTNQEYFSLGPRKKREKKFEALRDLFLNTSEKTPLVLIVEDLHWIDKTSEEFLDYFVGWVANTRIMLILLYRPEYTHQWGSKSYYTKVGLKQLGNASSSELVRAILHEGEIVPELEQLLLNRSAGNPLFMEELTYSLLENGTIQKKDKKYIVDRKISNIPVPDTIQGIIAARMDRLEENLKRTMQVASVIGREFAFRILQTISGMREEIKLYLQNLQGLELIYEKTLFPELEYIFKHALTQEVAYNSLLTSRRKEIHEKIGNAIEELYPHRLEEYYEMLAYHYTRSDNNNKAYHYLKLSGDKTRAGYANWEALRFYGEAIDVLDQMPPTDENKKEGIEARLSLAMPAMFLSYPEDTLNVIKAGVKMSREIGDNRSLAKLDGTLAHAYAIKGESKLAIEHAEKCFKRAQMIQDLDLMAPVARDLTSAYMFAGELSKAVPIFSAVIPLIEKSNKRSESFGRPASVYTFLCGLAGFIMGFLGSFNEAEILCEKALVNAIQNNNIYELAYSEFSYGIALMQKGDGQSTVEHLQKCVDYLEQSQMTTLMDPTLASLGLGYIYQGDLEKAKNFADHAIVAACQPEAASGNALLTQSLLAMVYSELGDLEKAHSCATEAVKLSKERMVGAWEGSAHVVYGSVLARMGKERLEEAEECIGKALMILNEYGLKPWSAYGSITLGEIYARSGQNKKAIEALQKARGMFREMGMDYWLHRTQQVLARL
jgi:tetratricopeptide (TPR) repeat protein